LWRLVAEIFFAGRTYTGDEARAVKVAAVGNRRGDVGHLQRRDRERALADGEVAGVAVAPDVVPRFLLPRRIGHDSRRFAAEADLRLAAEAERDGHVVYRLRTTAQAGVVEENVARKLQRFLRVERAVTGVEPAVKKFAADFKRTGAVECLARAEPSAFERGHERDGFENTAGRVLLADGAVDQRLVRVFGERIPV